jgi:hypothetical protein
MAKGEAKAGEAGYATDGSDTAPLSETVTVTLAHHYTDPTDGKAYLPGDTIELPRDTATGLVNAGWTTVDVEDRAAVAAALK